MKLEIGKCICLHCKDGREYFKNRFAVGHFRIKHPEIYKLRIASGTYKGIPGTDFSEETLA